MGHGRFSDLARRRRRRLLAKIVGALRDGVLLLVAQQLPSRGDTQIYLTHVREPEQIEQHVAQLLAKVSPLLLREPREVVVDLPLPLEDLAHLADLPDQREQQVA